MYVFGRQSDSIIRYLEDYFTLVLDLKIIVYMHTLKSTKHQRHLSPKNLQIININKPKQPPQQRAPTNQKNHGQNIDGRPQDLTISPLR